MKRGVIFAGILLLIIGLAGCTYTSDPVFGDCDTFLMYHDSCDRFMDSWAGSICEERYGPLIDIPSSDTDCYPKVECTRFFADEKTSGWLRKCRYLVVEPKCVMSFDIECTDFSASDNLLSIELRNKMDGHIKDVALQVVTEGGTFDCKDSDNDRILAANETDNFYCDLAVGEYLEGTLSLVYKDYRTGAMNTKSGSIVLVRGS